MRQQRATPVEVRRAVPELRAAGHDAHPLTAPDYDGQGLTDEQIARIVEGSTPRPGVQMQGDLAHPEVDLAHDSWPAFEDDMLVAYALLWDDSGAEHRHRSLRTARPPGRR